MVHALQRNSSLYLKKIINEVSSNIEKVRIFLSTVFKLEIFPSDIYFLEELPSEINIFSIFSNLLPNIAEISWHFTELHNLQEIVLQNRWNPITPRHGFTEITEITHFRENTLNVVKFTEFCSIYQNSAKFSLFPWKR